MSNIGYKYYLTIDNQVFFCYERTDGETNTVETGSEDDDDVT